MWCLSLSFPACVSLFQIDYDIAVRELQAELARGMSLEELQANSTVTVEKAVTSEPNQKTNLHTPSYRRRRHDVQKWLQKYAEPITKTGSVKSSALADLLKRSVGEENVVSQRSFHIRNYEIAVCNTINSYIYIRSFSLLVVFFSNL